MKTIFWLTANFLNETAKLTGLTYNEINIIVYYLLIPLSWTIMLDLIIGFPITTTLLLVAWFYIFYRTRNYFSRWCDVAFRKSADFLLWFKRIGWNYEVASVIICVLVPVVVYGLLIWGLVAR